MKDVFYILLAIALTAAASTLLGNVLLRSTRAKLYRSESLFLGFVLGSGCLAAVAFAIALAGVAHRGEVFGAAAIKSGAFHSNLLFNIPADPGQSERWLPKGWFGVFASIPFAARSSLLRSG